MKSTFPPARIGAVAWISGAVQFLVVNLIVQSAWTTPFSWADNNISDLGVTRCGMFDEDAPRFICSPLHDLMNTSMIVMVVFMIAGIVMTSRLWGRGVVSLAARFLLFCSAVGYLLAGLYPADVDLNLHVLGALLLTLCGNLGLILAGFASRDTPFGRVRGFTLLVGGAAILATWMHFTRNFAGLGMGGTERIAVFGLQVWMITIGCRMLTVSRRHLADSGSAKG